MTDSKSKVLCMINGGGQCNQVISRFDSRFCDEHRPPGPLDRIALTLDLICDELRKLNLSLSTKDKKDSLDKDKKDTKST